MGKQANRYLLVDPWAVVEEGFHPDRSQVSEAIFSLGNEFMGVRGNFEEGYSGEKLQGSYFNGVFEEGSISHPNAWKGMATRRFFMVNAVNWLYTRLRVDGETLDLATSAVTDFVRRLDIRTGTLTREFVWQTASGKSLKVTFTRFVSMATPQLGCQRVTCEALNFTGTVEVDTGLDFSILHEEALHRCVWETVRASEDNGVYAILAQTEQSRHRVFSSFHLNIDPAVALTRVNDEKYIGARFALPITPGAVASFEKIVVNTTEKKTGAAHDDVWARGQALAAQYAGGSFDAYWATHRVYWQQVWDKLDVTIEGDAENQQGVRFCIFQLHQTYHGQDPSLNVGAKGLTGESYEGATFWDTEAYCLPFYLFNNPQAAKSLLLYRYNTMPQALERAVEQDCRGACYPFTTIDGREGCGVWQHGNLEVHVSAAVAYGIWHYMHICDDKDFLYREGIEMLLQISRYFASRGGWNQRTREYGIYGVMGPDEFHMMVDNNCYTNVMVQKLLNHTLATMAEMRLQAPDALAAVITKVALDAAEPEEWARMAEKMHVPFDPQTGIYEQHDGFFDLPHVDVQALTEFPIYDHWAYDRIFRYDMLKQPDVLLLLFFYSQQYSLEAKRVNYEYYEPRCSHESSISPAIHAILAAEIGKFDDAYHYSSYATRLDLDDYNLNTSKGLHTTSLAAAWMDIVYGYGGMRSDGEVLTFKPAMPQHWASFSFRILYRGAILKVSVSHTAVTLTVVEGAPVEVEVFGTRYTADTAGISVPMPAERIAQLGVPA